MAGIARQAERQVAQDACDLRTGQFAGQVGDAGGSPPACQLPRTVPATSALAKRTPLVRTCRRPPSRLQRNSPLSWSKGRSGSSKTPGRPQRRTGAFEAGAVPAFVEAEVAGQVRESRQACVVAAGRLSHGLAAQRDVAQGALHGIVGAGGAAVQQARVVAAPAGVEIVDMPGRLQRAQLAQHAAVERQRAGQRPHRVEVGLGAFSENLRSSPLLPVAQLTVTLRMPSRQLASVPPGAALFRRPGLPQQRVDGELVVAWRSARCSRKACALASRSGSGAPASCRSTALARRRAAAHDRAGAELDAAVAAEAAVGDVLEQAQVALHHRQLQPGDVPAGTGRTGVRQSPARCRYSWRMSACTTSGCGDNAAECASSRNRWCAPSRLTLRRMSPTSSCGRRAWSSSQRSLPLSSSTRPGSSASRGSGCRWSGRWTGPPACRRPAACRPACAAPAGRSAGRRRG